MSASMRSWKRTAKGNIAKQIVGGLAVIFPVDGGFSWLIRRHRQEPHYSGDVYPTEAHAKIAVELEL